MTPRGLVSSWLSAATSPLPAPLSLFFKTNRAGELPIILKKKEQPRLGDNQTTRNNKGQLNWDINVPTTQLKSGWLDWDVNPHQQHSSNKNTRKHNKGQLDWDINTGQNRVEQRYQPPILGESDRPAESI